VLFRSLFQERLLEVKDPLAALANGVLVILARDLVVGGAGAEADRAQRGGDGERVQRPVDGRAGKAGMVRLDASGDLVGGAVRAERGDRVPDQSPLRGVA